MTYIIATGVAVEAILSDLLCFSGIHSGEDPQLLT